MPYFSSERSFLEQALSRPCDAISMADTATKRFTLDGAIMLTIPLRKEKRLRQFTFKLSVRIGGREQTPLILAGRQASAKRPMLLLPGD